MAVAITRTELSAEALRGAARRTKDGYRTSSPASCDAKASPRRARLAENHGKPSLGVFITDPWYKHTERRRRDRPRLCDTSPRQARFQY